MASSDAVWLPSALFEPPNASELRTTSLPKSTSSSPSLPPLRGPLAQLQQQHPLVLPRPRSTSALKLSVVELDHHAEVVRFLLEAKNNDIEAALDFLRRVFLTMTNSGGGGHDQ